VLAKVHGYEMQSYEGYEIDARQSYEIDARQSYEGYEIDAARP